MVECCMGGVPTVRFYRSANKFCSGDFRWLLSVLSHLSLGTCIYIFEKLLHIVGVISFNTISGASLYSVYRFNEDVWHFFTSVY